MVGRQYEKDRDDKIILVYLCGEGRNWKYAPWGLGTGTKRFVLAG